MAVRPLELAPSSSTPTWLKRPRALACGAALAGLLAAACSDSVSFPTGGSGGTGGGSGGTGGGVAPPPFEPAAAGMRRLIGRQYIGTIKLLLGDAAAQVVAVPTDPQLRGLATIGASDLSHEPESIELYEKSSRDAAAAAVADPATYDALLPCTPAAANDAVCLQQFIEEFGSLAWRRPMTAEEVQRVVVAGQSAFTNLGTFEDGVRTAISTILQSPYFLYIIELGTLEVEPLTGKERYKLTPHELATRLSFFLVDRGPDQALLDLADSGGLDDEAGIRAAAKQLLASAEAKGAVSDFFGEIYHLAELPDLLKDQAQYPNYTVSLRYAIQEETTRFLEDIIWTRNADAHEILTADYTFVNPELAPIYGLPAPASGSWEKVTLPPEQNRSGFLGQAAFLARFAHPNMTSPTRRGAFIRADLLCEHLDPPPPNANPVLPPDDPANPKTQRQKLEAHEADASCAGCHALIDPVGLALENYDAIGAYQTEEWGLPIDTTGLKSITLGKEAFASARDVATLMSEDPDKRFVKCLVRNVFRNSVGHVETEGETVSMMKLDDAFQASGFKLQAALEEITVTAAFRYVGVPR